MQPAADLTSTGSRNIAAVGGFELETKGTVVLLVDPVVEHDSSAAWAPVGVRQVLRVASATDYLQARQA
jgi:hypothetical protein